MRDDELQDLVERGSNHNHDDGLLYETLFRALRNEPEFTLPASFADRVIATVRARYSTRDMVWLMSGVALFIIALVVAVIVTGFSVTLGAFAFLSGYKGLVIFGLAFILGLQWIDRKWIRKPTL
jgi:hypothetical protein